MAFGKSLNHEDSKAVRTIIGESGVTALTFYPLEEGFAEYGTVVVTFEPERASAMSFIRSEPQFDKLMEIVSQHDYPAEFDDKFFVELSPVPDPVPLQGEPTTITLDGNSKAFYSGVAAGSRAADGLAPTPMEFDVRLSMFWLNIGVELGRTYTVEQADERDLFIQGAALRKPTPDYAVRLHIDSSVLAAYVDEEDDERARTALRALVEQAAQAIQDGMDGGEISNSKDQPVGQYTVHLY